MAAAHEDPPAVARQRVRRALRKAREGTPWSQGEVAKKLGWSLSKMQRIEAGEVGVSATDLRALLDVYGVTDPRRIQQLTEDARASRRQRYVMSPEYREHLPAGLLELLQFERHARSVRAYQASFYPGVLQTPAVAEAILAEVNRGLSDESRRVRVDVRMLRRQQLIEREDGPEYFLILDESVIRRRVRNIEVTLDQLDDILEIAQLPNVHIRIVPFARGAYMGALGAFQIVDLNPDDDESVLYREIYLRDEMVHDPEEVRFYRAAFENLWAQSLTEDATLRAVHAEAALLRSSLDFEETD